MISLLEILFGDNRCCPLHILQLPACAPSQLSACSAENSTRRVCLSCACTTGQQEGACES